MNRRLLVYFLIDVSESMVGEPLHLVEEGMAAIIRELKKDPYAMETAWISVLVFAGQARTLVPLQEIMNFYPPKFPVGGGTSLSRGLGHLMFEMRKSFVRTTYEQKGDWKPIVFLFTDGVPTDDTKAAVAEWKQSWQRTAHLVAVSFGHETDLHALSELTDHVLLFNNTDAGAYKKFFSWVTDSIKTSSVSVQNNSSGFEMAKPDGETLSKIDLSKKAPALQITDSNFVVLTAKCQHTKRPYLMKYRRNLSPSGIGDYQTLSYKLVGAFPVDQSYFELADETATRQKIHTDELIGSPACPCCGNIIGFAMCTCMNIHCIGEEQVSTCPWCGTSATYTIGEGGFDVNRAQG